MAEIGVAEIVSHDENDVGPTPLGYGHRGRKTESCNRTEQRRRAMSHHAFYAKLQTSLTEAGFDVFVEEVCKPYYAPRMGAPSLPPGRYFRMHMVGYFEGIDSERAIVWRCADSYSLRDFAAQHRSSDNHDRKICDAVRLNDKQARQRRPKDLIVRGRHHDITQKCEFVRDP